MFAQRQTNLEKVLLSAVAVLLLLTTSGRSEMLADILQTTAAPALPHSSLTTELNNRSMEEPKVLRSHRACGEGHENYCENGGECMYPQDSDKPFCICTSSYSGTRCMFFTETTHSLPEMEQLIGIIFGVVMLLCVLGIIICCLAQRRCLKSAPLIKSAPSETSV